MQSGIAAQIYAGIILKKFTAVERHFVVAMTSAEENGLSVGLRGFLQSTLPSLALKPILRFLSLPV